MNAFSRSWEITKMSFSVINKDREMLWFPVLAGFFSLLFLFVMIFPTLLAYIGISNDNVGYANLVLVFLAYLGLAFIATFFNVAVVYTTKTRFEGGDATFMDSIRFAFSKIYIIFLWSIVTAIVGVLLRILENFARNAKGGNQIVLQVLRGVLGMAWGIVTIFVVPILVYKGHTPINAIKESALTIKKTWGESLIRHFGLGLVQMLVTVLGIVVLGLVIFVTLGLSIYLTLVLVTLLVVYVVLVSLIFTVANSVFNTALYVYAQTGKIPEGFSKEDLSHAFIKR